MTINYDSTQVGVPYVRVHQILINYPDKNAMPTAVLSQSLAVKMLDGSIRQLENLPSLSVSFDMAAHGSDATPLVYPDTGLPIGANTTLNNTMLAILAVVRHYQNIAEQG